jgi:hypothetical protein
VVVAPLLAYAQLVPTGVNTASACPAFSFKYGARTGQIASQVNQGCARVLSKRNTPLRLQPAGGCGVDLGFQWAVRCCDDGTWAQDASYSPPNPFLAGGSTDCSVPHGTCPGIRCPDFLDAHGIQYTCTAATVAPVEVDDIDSVDGIVNDVLDTLGLNPTGVSATPALTHRWQEDNYPPSEHPGRVKSASDHPLTCQSTWCVFHQAVKVYHHGEYLHGGRL